MTISVVMATYNGEEFIKEQLDSIRLQTTAVDEVIMCDDGSIDNTYDVAKQYADLYKGKVVLLRETLINSTFLL